MVRAGTGITDVEGVAVGHWTDDVARTGCTVVLLPPGTVAAAEVRGGGPGTLGFDGLRPERAGSPLDAVFLAGGSAFGLATGAGVMRWLEDEGRGVPYGGSTIPIVAGMILFDLAVGDGSVRPGPDEGRAACAAASSGAVATGAVGAGTGATIDKWRGTDHRRPGGLGTAAFRLGDLVVGALVAVNAVGALRGPGGLPADADAAGFRAPPTSAARSGSVGSTTIGVVATNARLDRLGAFLVAQNGHNGMARALEPVHTTADGDALVACATGAVVAERNDVCRLAAKAVEAAIRQGLGAVGP